MQVCGTLKTKQKPFVVRTCFAFWSMYAKFPYIIQLIKKCIFSEGEDTDGYDLCSCPSIKYVLFFQTCPVILHPTCDSTNSSESRTPQIMPKMVLSGAEKRKRRKRHQNMVSKLPKISFFCQPGQHKAMFCAMPKVGNSFTWLSSVLSLLRVDERHIAISNGIWILKLSLPCEITIRRRFVVITIPNIADKDVWCSLQSFISLNIFPK